MKPNQLYLWSGEINCVCVSLEHARSRDRCVEENYQNEGDLKLGEEADVRVEERDRVSNLHDVVLGRDTTDEDSVDSGGLVLKGVKNQLYVGWL